MIYTVLSSYLVGWLVTSIGLGLIAGKLQDPVLPPSHPMPFVVAAGAAWPMVVLGAAQMAAIALVMNVARNSAFTDNELDALLEERSHPTVQFRTRHAGSAYEFAQSRSGSPDFPVSTRKSHP